MVLVWVVAFLSIILSFWVKFLNRTDKTKFNPIFWGRDNYPELIVSFLSMVILLIIASRVTFDTSKILEKIPWITSLPMDLIVAAFVGYLNNTLWYWLVNIGKKKLGVSKP